MSTISCTSDRRFVRAENRRPGPPVLTSSRSRRMTAREGSDFKSLAGTAMLMPPLRLQMMSPPQTPLKAALRACAGSLGLVFAYSCSYNLLLLAPSIYLLQIYDRVLSSRSGDTLLMLTLIVAFTVVVGGVLDALRRAALGRIGEWLEDRTSSGSALRVPRIRLSSRSGARIGGVSRSYDPASVRSSPEHARCCLTCSGRRSSSAFFSSCILCWE